MKKVNNFIDFLKQYDTSVTSIVGLDDFVEDTKSTHLWNKENLTDKYIFEDLNSRIMCNEAQRIYEELKLEYLDFISGVE